MTLILTVIPASAAHHPIDAADGDLCPGWKMRFHCIHSKLSARVFKAQASTDLVVTCHLPTCTLKRKCHTPTYKTISFACPCTCTFLTCSKPHADSNSSGAPNSDLPGIAEDAEAPERPSRRLRLRARRSRRALAEQYCERSAALRASGEIRVGLHPFLLCAMAVCSLISSFVRLQQDQGMACLFPLL